MRAQPGDPRDGVYKSLLTFTSHADANAMEALDPLLVELIKIRVSQINGCAFCLRQHTRDSLRLGEDPDRLAVLPAWRETSYFSDVEGAALRLAESITGVSKTHVSDEDYDAAAAAMTDEQIVATMWVAIGMNALNRLAITCRYEVGPN